MTVSNSQEEFAPKRAVKSQVKLKLAITGPSGSGKTEGALALATNLCKAMGFTTPDQIEGKIMVVDTENDSASLYAAEPGIEPGPGRYIFDTVTLRAPYTSERYKKAMQAAVDGKFLFLIVDTISAQWAGDGGVLRRKDKADSIPGANQWTNWAKFDPEYASFVEFLLQIPIHTIVTMRTKQKYVQETVGGKTKIRKLGMEPTQRDGIEYEFTVVFDVDMVTHRCVVSKDRTRLFLGADEVFDLLDPDVSAALHKWRISGAEMAPVEWKPQIDEPKAGAKKSPPVAEPKRADASVFLSAEDRQRFWVDAKKHKLGPEYTETQLSEDLRIWMFDTFGGITTTTQLPLSRVNEARIWAQSPPEKRTLAVGERKARDAANILNMNEAELRGELQVASGDWEEVASSLGSKIDAAAER
jgi:hypothetical protein